MFGLFGKKKPITEMDNFIEAVYGKHPPPKRAILSQVIKLAHVDLLGSQIDWNMVVVLATELNKSPIPYSTHDLAISVAHFFYKKPENIGLLRDAHLEAQACAIKWLEEEKVAPIFVRNFEDTLLEMYKPPDDENQQDFLIVDSMRQLTDLAASQGLIQSKEEAVDYWRIFKERIRNARLKGNSVTLHEVESAIEEELEPIFQSSTTLVNNGVHEDLALAQCVVSWYKTMKFSASLRAMLLSSEYKAAALQIMGNGLESWGRIGEQEMLSLTVEPDAYVPTARSDARDKVVARSMEIAAIMPQCEHRRVLEAASKLLADVPVVGVPTKSVFHL